MTRSRGGFTLVELIVVIVVIGILATIGILGFSKYQAQSRDSLRASRATTIAEALEKYYDVNGEYPSCSSLTADADSVTEGVLPGLDIQSLTTPTGTSNSISCADLTSVNGADTFSYTGDVSDACIGTEGVACSTFILKYKSEATGQIVSISSRRNVNISTCSVITNDICPTNFTVTVPSAPTGFTALDASWGGVQGAVGYELQYSQNSTFASGVTTVNLASTATTPRVSSLTICTTYYLRVRAVGAVGDRTGWSLTESAKTACIATPPNFKAVAASSTSVTVSWSAATNATSYEVKRSPTTDFSSATATSQTALTRTDTGLTAGTQYCYTVRGANSGNFGNWTTGACVTPQVCVPVGVTASTVSATSISVTWTPGSGCTPTSYNLRYSTSSTFATSTTVSGVTSPRSITGLSPGTTYYVQVQAVVSGTPGSWSASDNTMTNVNPPATFTATASTTTAIALAWSASAGADGYIIERSTSSSFSTINATLTPSSSATSASVTGLIPATTYYFRIRATLGEYESTNRTANATTKTPTVTLSAAKYCSDVYSGRDAYQIRVKVDEVSYNLTANTSVVNWSIYRYSLGGYNSWDQTKTWPWSVTVNGTSSSGSSNSVKFKTNDSAGVTESISSGSRTVTHNTDGTKTISFSGYDGTSSNKSVIFGVASCSSTYVLSDLR